MRLLGLLGIALAACAHHRPSPASALPAGCENSIAGTWTHEDNASYRYTATDDGTVAHLIPRRVNADGSPIPEEGEDREQMEVTLERSATGFQGGFRMEPLTDGGGCPALFLARMTACSPDRIVLQLEQSYALDPTCQRIDFGQADIVDHVLVRVKP
jgi:hypothetical protein